MQEQSSCLTEDQLHGIQHDSTLGRCLIFVTLRVGGTRVSSKAELALQVGRHFQQPGGPSCQPASQCSAFGGGLS